MVGESGVDARRRSLHLSLATCALVAVVSATLTAQAPPQFEVVSIKINRSTTRNSGMGPRPDGGIAATNATLRNLILWAWELNTFELVGGPDWIDEDRFDIVATAAGTPNLATTRAMTRTFLEDRFKLVLRKEIRERPVYVLGVVTAGRPGPALRPSTVDCAKAFCGSLVNDSDVKSTGITIDEFAEAVADIAGRVIVNRTGLTGSFDVDVKGFAPDSGQTTPELPSFFTVVREQLGLKLDAATAPIDVFIITGAERPSEN